MEPRDATLVRMGPLLHDMRESDMCGGAACLSSVISDCFDEVESLLGGLQHLRFGGHEVIVFHILHPDEMDFPFNGMVKFDALEEKMHLMTAPRSSFRPHVPAGPAEIPGRDAEGLGGAANRSDYYPDEHGQIAGGGIADGSTWRAASYARGFP